ncbi:MAG: hypothetical protein AAGA56_03740 [Myxococcota bacterium]
MRSSIEQVHSANAGLDNPDPTAGFPLVAFAGSLALVHAPSRRLTLLGGYYLLCLVALTWPGYAAVGNRLQPYLLGLPPSLVWNIGWVALSFVVLLSYHLTHDR